jgi:Glu-tRNA(Gln) amidotransferase subunit E-like FAD-binding protein
MEKNGLSWDYLFKRLKDMVDDPDRRVSARYLAIAFTLAMHGKTARKKPSRAVGNFDTRKEAAARVAEKMGEMEGLSEEEVAEIVGEITGAGAQEE